MATSTGLSRTGELQANALNTSITFYFKTGGYKTFDFTTRNAISGFIGSLFGTGTTVPSKVSISTGTEGNYVTTVILLDNVSYYEFHSPVR